MYIYHKSLFQISASPESRARSESCRSVEVGRGKALRSHPALTSHPTSRLRSGPAVVHLTSFWKERGKADLHECEDLRIRRKSWPLVPLRQLSANLPAVFSPLPITARLAGCLLQLAMLCLFPSQRLPVMDPLRFLERQPSTLLQLQALGQCHLPVSVVSGMRAI